MRKKLLIVGTTLLILIAITPTNITNLKSTTNKTGITQNWDWRISWDFIPDELYLGISARCEIWLKNTGDQDLHIHKILLQWDWQGDYAYYHNVDEYLKPGEEELLGAISFPVPTNIQVGYHSFRVGVAQEHKTWYGWVDDGWVWMEGWAEKKILQPPQISITYCSFDTTTAKVDDIITLRIKVKNNGEATAYDITVRISLPSGFVLYGSPNPATILEIPSGSIKEVTFKLYGTKEGTFVVSVTVQSSNAGSDTSTAEITLKGFTATDYLVRYSNGFILLTIGAIAAIATIIIKRRH
ncbi:MAG: CARDB domain-containing protein [Candidatus Njordarchaeia archaeon]